MTKVIDIQQLKIDVIAEFTKGNVDIPGDIMNNIIQMHGPHAPAQTGMKFTVKRSGKEINFVVNVDKALGHTAICGVLSSDLSPVVYALVKHQLIEKETTVNNIIDIGKLKLDIASEFTQKNLTIPDAAMLEIIQMHLLEAPFESETRFVINDYGTKYDCHVNVNKLVCRTGITVIKVGEAAASVYITVKHHFIEKETIMFEPCKETFGDRIKSIYGHVRLNTLLSCLKKSKTPLEAFHVLIEYLEEDTEISGTLGRKESTVKYSFCYDKGARQVAAKLTIFNKADAATPIVDIELNLNDKNIDILYQSVLSMMNLVK